MRNFPVFLVFCLLAASCASNKEKAIEDVCSTANVNYTGTITSIINAGGCLACHSGPSPVAGFNLETYEQVKAKATQLRNGTSVLYGAVAHRPGFTPMPQGGAQLSTCDITRIKAWIDNGTPQ